MFVMLTGYHEMSGEEHIKKWKDRANCGRKTLRGNSSHLDELKDIANVRHVTKCHMMNKKKQNLPVATDSRVAVIFY